MKCIIRLVAMAALFTSCKSNDEKRIAAEGLPITGTWELVSATIVEKGDTTVNDHRQKQKTIKIINDSHFAFLTHDYKKGKDSSAVFVAGGGSYSLTGDQYTEHLEYCNFREWEDNTFQFTVTIQADTLVQRGIEKIEEIGVDRLNVEKYVRVKNQVPASQ